MLIIFDLDTHIYFIDVGGSICIVSICIQFFQGSLLAEAYMFRVMSVMVNRALLLINKLLQYFYLICLLFHKISFVVSVSWSRWDHIIIVFPYITPRTCGISFPLKKLVSYRAKSNYIFILFWVLKSLTSEVLIS